MSDRREIGGGVEDWFVRPKGNSGWKTGLSDPRAIRGGQENWFVRPKGNRGWGGGDLYIN